MSETFGQLEQRLRDYYGRPVQALDRDDVESARAFLEVPPGPSVPREGARAFSTFDDESLKTMITAPITKAGQDSNPYFMWLQGAFVGAEKPNRNGALWSTEDLELGHFTVKNGPLNWLHDERKIVGTISDARMVKPNELANHNPSVTEPYIDATSVLWKFLWPNEAAFVSEQAQAGNAYYSMECISKQIACQAADCGTVVGYIDGMRGQGDTCQHITERSAARRFIDPIFLGGAIIVPPAQPGWANAHLKELAEAANQAERATATGVAPDIAEVLVAQVLTAARA